MEAIITKAKSIRLMIFDVDGVLTNGKLIYGPTGMESKEFHAHDGQGIKYLARSGVEIGIITGCSSTIVAQRMKDLGIKHVYQGSLEKMPAYLELKQKLQLTDEQIAYMGDDLPDLPLIQQAGLGIAVANASSTIKEYACWVTNAKGGEGAVREVCDLIMRAQGSYDALIQSLRMIITHPAAAGERGM